jgi:hypothetical protein
VPTSCSFNLACCSTSHRCFSTLSLAGLLGTLWLGMQRAPDDGPEPRWQRRNRSKGSHKQHRKRFGWSPGSIKRCKFHRQYPLSLRSSGHFVRNAPKLDRQHLHSNLPWLMGALQDHLWQIGMLCWRKPKRNQRQRAPNAITRCKGGTNFGKFRKKKGCRIPKYRTTWEIATLPTAKPAQLARSKPMLIWLKFNTGTLWQTKALICPVRRAFEWQCKHQHDFAMH